MIIVAHCASTLWIDDIMHVLISTRGLEIELGGYGSGEKGTPGLTWRMEESKVLTQSCKLSILVVALTPFSVSLAVIDREEAL